jgi:hypothetical protein
MLTFAPPPKHEHTQIDTKPGDSLVDPTKKVSKSENIKEEMKQAGHGLKEEMKHARKGPKKYWNEASTRKKVAIVGGAVVVGVVGVEAIGAVGHLWHVKHAAHAAGAAGHLSSASDGLSAAYVNILLLTGSLLTHPKSGNVAQMTAANATIGAFSTMANGNF